MSIYSPVLSKGSIRKFSQISLMLILALTSQYVSARPSMIVGDYAAAPLINGRVDSDLLLERLRELNVNTYMWLIWRNKSDWDDLKEFLPKANAAGIKVWAYLVPPSETEIDHKGYPYSEPYRVDYIRWAQEIAKLSLQQPNLVGYVIDDFWSNIKPGRFSKEYIASFVRSGKELNPNLKFYPLIYFNEINPDSAKFLSKLVDGIIAAYPHSEASIRQAAAFLNDNYTKPASIAISYPPATRSSRGDMGLLSTYATITNAENARLTFHYSDDFDGPTHGYRQFQLRVDDQIVWTQDIAGHTDSDVTIDLSKSVLGKRVSKLSLGLVDIAGVSNFPVSAAISQLSAQGIALPALSSNRRGAWQAETIGAFDTQITAKTSGQSLFHVPMILMPASDTRTFEKMYQQTGTLSAISDVIGLSLRLAADGTVEGVVTYGLNKSPTNQSFEMVKHLYKQSVK